MSAISFAEVVNLEAEMRECLHPGWDDVRIKISAPKMLDLCAAWRRDKGVAINPDFMDLEEVRA